jgi:hypothetical protein
MKAAGVVSAYMLQATRPLFWHIGVKNDGVLRGASTFILQFADRYVAVTADHVIAQYLEAMAADERTLCQIGFGANPLHVLGCSPEHLRSDYVEPEDE